MSALTGESIPADRKKGDRVISGSVNMTGVIYVRTESVYENSTVSKILELVENSSAKKAKTENFITRFARYYTPCVVICAALLALIPSVVTGEWSVWVNRALIFLVVSCPCALVISVPLSFFGGIGGASRHGVLIKGANYLEALASVDTVVFDKTGTLTKGSFSVTEINSNSLPKDELLRIAAEAESFSTHPVARSVVAAYGKAPDKSRVNSIGEIAGMGMAAIIVGEKYYLGNKTLMSKVGVDISNEEIPCGTVIYISKGKEYLGNIVISDEIKHGSPEAIRSLKTLGIKKTVMLTGDRASVAESVGASLAVDSVCAGLMPADKVAEVELLIKDGARLAFVGDGINDAPVLSLADVGIAMGSLGSDAAIESADVVIMDDDLSKIAVAIRIARKTLAIVRQNIVFALGVKGIILILGALGIANMWIAVFGDVGVMVIAILNAMRAMKKVKN
jgi:Cd2+/Zn2+-exporting ATPase